ncbi:hypothetical protein MTR_7g089270 [Medicago truncatula]|uniref:Uncharacterized protein n=1 Tax=Medicago truncatula TaxID=3880 RepID=G7L5W6_MEDTR|nr:hypothetical protein MTR_7g089270 [Medicago truncatula]
MEESEHSFEKPLTPHRHPLLLEQKTHLMSGVACKEQGYHYKKPKPFIIGANPPTAVNHALIARSSFIIQTYVPVSLEIKDTVVRSYRTDPVQVRS